MVRLSIGAIALVMMTMGCTGLIDGGSDGETPEQTAARNLWINKATPALTNCVSCHNGSRPNVGFLAGTGDLEIRTTLMAFDPAAVNLDAPPSSRLLTKGAHEGPSLTATETSDVLEWIRAEKDAEGSVGDPTPRLETVRFTPAICTSGSPPAPTCPVNDVDLSAFGIPGARLHFVAQALGSGLYLNQLSLFAGADGAYMKHPLFVSYPAEAEPQPDMLDRFYSVTMNLMPNTDAQILGGTASFPNFVATDAIAIAFQDIKAFQPDTGGPGPGPGGCKMLASFKANAQSMFTTAVGGAAQNCLQCHGGQNNGATSALALTGVNAADDATIQLACNQVLTRVVLNLPDTSGLFLALDPAAAHPLRFNAAQLNTFKNGPPGAGILKWIDDERTAP